MGLTPAKIYSKQITKRSLKKFNGQNWNNSLATEGWSGVENETDINVVVVVEVFIVCPLNHF